MFAAVRKFHFAGGVDGGRACCRFLNAQVVGGRVNSHARSEWPLARSGGAIYRRAAAGSRVLCPPPRRHPIGHAGVT